MNKCFQKNILVTGAAGFIGSNFVHFILNADPTLRIVSLDKLTYAGNRKNLENLPAESRHIFIQGDICDSALINNVLSKYHIDIIVNFAAETHVDRSITNPAAFIQTNIVGTFTLLEAARAYRCRFHHISTDEVYGELQSDEPPFTENSPYRPSSPYSASKASIDHIVRSYIRTYQLPATISNCSNNYGPKQHAEKLIPTVIHHCIEQKPIPVYGNGSNIRDWLYVDDHCHAIWEILNKGVIGETYNIGANTEKDNLSLIKMICAIMDRKYPTKNPYANLITFVQDRLGHDWRYALNTNKINTAFGWRAKLDLYDGLNLTIDYYLKNLKLQAV